MKKPKFRPIKAIKTIINSLLTAINSIVDNAWSNLSTQFPSEKHCPATILKLVDASDRVQVCVILDLHPITPSTNVFVCVGTKKHIATRGVGAGQRSEFKLFNFLEKVYEKYIFA